MHDTIVDGSVGPADLGVYAHALGVLVWRRSSSSSRRRLTKHELANVLAKRMPLLLYDVSHERGVHSSMYLSAAKPLALRFFGNRKIRRELTRIGGSVTGWANVTAGKGEHWIRSTTVSAEGVNATS